MEAFPKLVHDALFEVDNTVRSAAEKKVSDFLSAEPSKFLQFTVAELANENNSEALRQACGTLFVRALRVQVSLLFLYFIRFFLLFLSCIYRFCIFVSFLISILVFFWTFFTLYKLYDCVDSYLFLFPMIIYSP